MTAPRRLTDDELINLLREAYEVMEPVPQHVLDQGKAAFLQRAQELRPGGVPVTARPDLLPGGPVVLDDHAGLPGHQTARVGGEADAVSATAAGAAGLGSPAWNPVKSAAAPARLTAVRIAAGIAAFLLLIPLAVALGLLVGDLALLYLP